MGGEPVIADWILLNKNHIRMLLIAIRHEKERPMRPQFAEYLRQAESKLQDSLRLIGWEEQQEEEQGTWLGPEYQQEAERIWEGTHKPGSKPPWR